MFRAINIAPLVKLKNQTKFISIGTRNNALMTDYIKAKIDNT